MSKTKFTRVLIANRGAIAVRIIRTLKKMGIESIAIYAEADRESLHVRMADQALSLGDGPASATYLNQDKIVKIAHEYSVQAIHPGYGFLSENTEFVSLCERSNIVFIGPTAKHIEAFGLKHKARELARLTQVPLLPGSQILSDSAEATQLATQIGYPVMLKSTAGGGGIGMQLCRNADELIDAWGSVSTLSANNFSNADLFIEKFVEHARHIEVQIFADGQGHAVAIGERDCSAQRRNQKVLEETPAPNLSEELRQTLQRSAVDLVNSINYRNAGTVEFILDADSQQFYFLEVNTRLQVEHGVTEEVYDVDIVAAMINLAMGQLSDLSSLESLTPVGHAIQARVYAEDPNRNFQPCAGLLSYVNFPDNQLNTLRVDTWIETGVEVSPYYDPMLAKIIAVADNREQALTRLEKALEQCEIYGIETNISYLSQLIRYKPFNDGQCLTASLKEFSAHSHSVQVLLAGTMTTIQDSPGRVGYWDVGVPPSGPFDNISFRLGNRLLGNAADAAGLEMTMNGAHLKFSSNCQIVLTGALMEASIDGRSVEFWQIITINAGQILRLGKVIGTGSRAYILFSGGLNCPDYLGSKSTFTLGQFGGHAGRALKVGDVLRINQPSEDPIADNSLKPLIPAELSQLTNNLAAPSKRVWQLRVIAGPQGAPDYFSDEYIQTFFDATWQVHYNSSRTGVRLIGPKPIWTRNDGGEAGLHPSNIHDNAYAIGTIDFTGDMPVILGPDGPSLGGFVCPATVISADFWKVGQLSAGDDIQFIAVDQDTAVEALKEQDSLIENLQHSFIATNTSTRPAPSNSHTQHFLESIDIDGMKVTLRQSGDSYLLVEYGPHMLDIELRFHVHQLMLSLQEKQIQGVFELTPGIRSLQIHYDLRVVSRDTLIEKITTCAQQLVSHGNATVPSRIVHLPISWDDEQCRLAIDKYHQSVRSDAPWYPSNIEFIRRINGLASIEEVKKTVFDARYLVMGLGDVYLGAPVATPLNPAHRLVTTKYNPARTWTAENSVGIGGSYLCVYGMEGPGGYQFIGRTLQMWNRYRVTKEFSKPWLLRFFDQIQFYPVSHEELLQIRKDFPLGKYSIEMEATTFSLENYRQNLIAHDADIKRFTNTRQAAFDDELTRWKRDGQFHFEPSAPEPETTEHVIPEGRILIESPVAGSIWEHLVKVGDVVKAGQTVSIVESMKMEIQVNSPVAGLVEQVIAQKSKQITTGGAIIVVNPATQF